MYGLVKGFKNKPLKLITALCSTSVLPDPVATRFVWLFSIKLIKIKYNKKSIPLVALVTFQKLSSRTWLVTPRLDSTE